MKIFIGKPFKTHRINRFLHGSFFEYFGTAIYDGIWVGKNSSIPNVDGIRLSLIECLCDAGITMLRWPGGCCADHYHWRDGVGSDRLSHIHPCPPPDIWRHEFGTDEFLKLCQLKNTEPMIVVNTATDSPKEFLAWFEYVNGPTNTGYGKMRADNGHPEPYNVTYWGFGNTDENVWWPYENEPEEYAKIFRRFITSIRDLRPFIKIISAGLNTKHPERPGWNARFLKYTNTWQGKTYLGPDYISNHQYIGALNKRDSICSDAVDYSDEAYYAALSLMDSYYKADIDALRTDITLYTPLLRKTSKGLDPAMTDRGAQNITKVSFDEWGMWHPEATEEQGQRMRQTMRDAIFAAGALHLFYRESDIVEIAMQTQTINFLQSLMETNNELYFYTPTYWVMKLLKEHQEQYLVECVLEKADKMLDMVVTMNNTESRLVTSIVNRDLYEQKQIRLILPDRPEVWKTVAADIIAPKNVRLYNTFEQRENVTAKPFEFQSGDSIILPPHSIVRIVLET